jgi:steroid 5-alpha reductase family enzyme
MRNLLKDRLILLFIYLVTFAIAGFIGNSYTGLSPLLRLLLAVLSATVVLWLFSFLSDNSSIFDPYWSVAPPLFLICLWAFMPGNRFPASGHESMIVASGSLARNITVFLLVFIWSVRLTWNFLRGWKGLKHEDWRYAAMRKRTGMFYWTISFAGIHLFPAMMVFLGCLSLWVVALKGVRGPNILDLLGILVTGFAILLEADADRQLHRFVATDPGNGKTLQTGLWSVSRHPNYLGEIGFWWGLFFFSLAADPDFWWVIIGPVAITLMFVFISIPMIEKRMQERRTDYGEYRKKVRMLFPFFNVRPS